MLPCCFRLFISTFNCHYNVDWLIWQVKLKEKFDSIKISVTAKCFVTSVLNASSLCKYHNILYVNTSLYYVSYYCFMLASCFVFAFNLVVVSMKLILQVKWLY